MYMYMLVFLFYLQLCHFVAFRYYNAHKRTFLKNYLHVIILQDSLCVVVQQSAILGRSVCLAHVTQTCKHTQLL